MKRRPWLHRVWDLLGWNGKKVATAYRTKQRSALPRRCLLEPLEKRELLAILYWDSNGSTAGLGGSGTWDATSAYWNTRADGSGSTQAWVSGSDAVFTGTAGTVSLSGQMNANSITFNTSEYQLQNGSLVAPSGGMTINVSTGTSTISSVIGGSGGVTKSGEGALTLSGTNTFTGGTAVSAGTLQFAGGGLGSSGTIAVAGNSTLRWSDSNTQDISDRISIQANANATLDVGSNTVACAAAIANAPLAPGALIKAGTGTLTLTGSDRFQSVTINAGTLQVSGSGVSTIGYGNITNNGSLVFNSNNNLSIGGVISGTGSVTQQGTGVLTFTGTNTYSGGTTVSAGTLMVGAADTSFTLTAQLSVAVAGKTITFIDDTASAIIGTAVTNTSGIASINYVLAGTPSVGGHSIRAVYGSTSRTITTPLAGWAYRKAITISNANVDADLTNFPLFVKINADADIGAGALANGYDIRFTAAGWFDAVELSTRIVVGRRRGGGQRWFLGEGAYDQPLHQHHDLHLLRQVRCYGRPGPDGRMGFGLQGGVAPRRQWQCRQRFRLHEQCEQLDEPRGNSRQRRKIGRSWQLRRELLPGLRQQHRHHGQ